MCVFEAARGIVPAGKQRGKAIDYRHLIPTLKHKPAAVARWVLRDDMFPRAEYRLTWERLSEMVPERQACKVMVGLLDLAARGACEVELAQVLGDLLQAGTLPELAGLEEEFAPKETPVPDIKVQLPALADFDRPIEVAAWMPSSTNGGARNAAELATQIRIKARNGRAPKRVATGIASVAHEDTTTKASSQPPTLRSAARDRFMATPMARSAMANTV